MNSNSSDYYYQFVPLFKSVAAVLGLLRKYTKTIVFSFLASIVIFTALFLSKTKVYKTEMIVTSSVITSERVAIIIDPLGKLAREGNYTELANLMNLDSVVASRIEDITAKELKDETKTMGENYDGEVLRQQNCLVVLKILKDKSLADTIQSGILYYLRNNQFVKRRSQIDRQNLEFMKIRIQREIKELDALKEKINNEKLGSSMMDPSAINNSIANLYGQELGINGKMQLEDSGINIIRDITNFKSPVSPKSWMYMIATLFLGFFLSVFFILINEINAYNKVNHNN